MSDAPSLGHNNPPALAPSLELEAEEWAAWLEQAYTPAMHTKKAEVLGSFEKFKKGFPQIDSDETQGRAGNLRSMLEALVKHSKTTHEQQKAPVLRATRAIDSYKNTWDAPLLAAVALVKQRQTDYGIAKERKAREEARAVAAEKQRIADEMAAAASANMDAAALDEVARTADEAERATMLAQAPAAVLSRVTGVAGVTSLRTTYKLNVAQSDLLELAKAVIAGTAPLDYLAFNEPRIGVAIRSEKVREIPGCVIDEVKSA